MLAYLSGIRLRASESSIIEAEAHWMTESESNTLPREAKRLKVLFGIAWVSSNGEDIILNKGQEFNLLPGRYPAVISPLKSGSLAYCVD
jgi:hypothetical protein